MPGFSSPDCKNMIDFQKAIASMPSSYKLQFDAMSQETLDKVTDASEGVVTVWEVSDDLDGLFQIMDVLFKLKGDAMVASSAECGEQSDPDWGTSTSPSGRKKKRSKRKGPGMVIISREVKDRDAYGRVVESMRYWLNEQGDTHLDETATAFGSIVIVRGVHYTSEPVDDAELKEAVNRIDIVLGKVVKMTTSRHSTSSPKLIWHHGPIISLLLHWINHTSSTYRNALSAITLAAPLTFTSGAKPAPHAVANSPADFSLLARYASKLSIPVLFLDPTTQLLHYPFLSTYMYYLGFYITLFLPRTVTTPHYYKALDKLVAFAFGLRARECDGEHGFAVVKKVKAHLDGTRSKRWAKTCIDPTSYNLAAAAGTSSSSSSSPLTEKQVFEACTLADCPWDLLDDYSDASPLPYFTRLPLSPSSPSSPSSPTPPPPTTTSMKDLYTASPIAFSFATSTYAITSSTPFRVLVPKPGTDLPRATKALQLALTQTLTLVRNVRTLPKVSSTVAKMWNDAVGAIAWALGRGCVEELKGDLKAKVESFGRGLVVEGCWGVCVRAEEEERKKRKEKEKGNGGEGSGGWVVVDEEDGKWGKD